MLELHAILLAKQWHDAQLALHEATTRERQVRDAFVAQVFPGAIDGTHHAEVGNGYSIKYVQTTRLDIVNTPAMKELVNKFAQHGETSAIAQKLLSWKPRLSVTQYKALPLWARGLLDEHVTSTPNAPQLELMVPKVSTS